MVADLRRERGRHEQFPEVVLVFQAAEEAGRRFFEQHWPDARAIADPGQELYAAFGLHRGAWGKLLGPSVWKAGWRALRKGHGVGRPVGDPRVMPGAFLVRDGTVTWTHDFDHAGDHPDWSALRAPPAAEPTP